MRAGMLRHRIDVQALSTTPDGWGDAVEAWADYATDVPATVTPVSGSEMLEANETVAEVTWKVHIRYSAMAAGITPRHRILFGSKQLAIVAVINSGERNRRLELLCKQVNA